MALLKRLCLILVDSILAIFTYWPNAHCLFTIGLDTLLDMVCSCCDGMMVSCRSNVIRFAKVW